MQTPASCPAFTSLLLIFTGIISISALLLKTMIVAIGITTIQTDSKGWLFSMLIIKLHIVMIVQ